MIQRFAEDPRQEVSLLLILQRALIGGVASILVQKISH